MSLKKTLESLQNAEFLGSETTDHSLYSCDNICDDFCNDCSGGRAPITIMPYKTTSKEDNYKE